MKKGDRAMCYGKGKISLRKIEIILKNNGFIYVRNNGHQIWRGPKGNMVVIPRSCCTYIIDKIIKDNCLEID